MLPSRVDDVLSCAPCRSAAAELDISAKPVLMATERHACDLMVTGPGSYRFTDYRNLGPPLLTLFVAVAVFLVPVIWRF